VDLLLAGYTARAMAMSALAGGYRITTLDYFGDRDLKEIAPNLSLKRDLHQPFREINMIQAGRSLHYDAISYGAGLENQPEAVAALAGGVMLIGNSPETLTRVRDWARLQDFCQRNSIPFPVTLASHDIHLANPQAGWLVKPAKGGGGRGVRTWKGEQIDQGCILQARIQGMSASASFLADGERAFLLGLSKQLIGLDALNAKAFQWCGNITPLPLDGQDTEFVEKQVRRILDLLVRHFDLRGCGGIDFMVTGKPGEGKVVWPLEVNPRYTGAMELFDEIRGESTFDMHVKACSGHLPQSFAEPACHSSYRGKGIVYAPLDLQFNETGDWFAKQRRDIPHSGDWVRQGNPVCTVLCQETTYESCIHSLERLAADVVKEGKCLSGLADEVMISSFEKSALPGGQPDCEREIDSGFAHKDESL
jgi:predicted ATP-grasp superfamily ATP-dependent carboligase